MSVCKGDVKGFHKLLKNGIKTESSIILLLNILQLSCTSEVYGKKTERKGLWESYCWERGHQDLVATAGRDVRILGEGGGGGWWSRGLIFDFRRSLHSGFYSMRHIAKGL